MNKTRVRIAPSPTGYPHIGTIFQALINFSYAKKHEGKFIVRIEDTDRSRFVEDAEEKIFEAIEWFDLMPDESTKHGGDYGPYRQSERLDTYKQYANKLIAEGNAYYCFCSKDRLDEVRKNMQKDGKPPMYDKHCRNISKEESKKRSESENHVIRMKIPSGKKISFTDEIRGKVEFDSSVVDDQVILKSDGYPTYHLAVVVDDHLMNISHIVRGEEWISSAPKHVLLYEYLGWNVPKIIHTPALRNPDKSKLSKRHGHASVSWYIKNGYLKEAIINFLITRVWNHPQNKEIFDIDEIIKHFDFKNMHIQGPIVDLDKLNWINGQWIRNMKDEELKERLNPFIPKDFSHDNFFEILPLIKDRLVTLSEFDSLTHYFYKNPSVDKKLILKESKSNDLKISDYLNQLIETISDTQEWDAKSLESKLRDLQERVGWKPRPAFMSIRIAITGELHTPPLFDTMVVLGKEEVIKRLSNAKKIFD
ncbi:glutamate--tRNA ligase [Patescibacteria group bacterium]